MGFQAGKGSGEVAVYQGVADELSGLAAVACSKRPVLGSWMKMRQTMLVYLFRGPGRVFGFTEAAGGENLPARFAPWSSFKAVEMNRDVPTPGVDVVECLDDIEKYGFHVTDAHVRITESLV